MLPRKDNLVVHMPLNGAKDPSGKALDISGKNNHGTISGTEAYADNPFGNRAQSFDGVNTANNVSIPVSNSILSITSQITVFGFFKAISTEVSYAAIMRSTGGFNSFGLDYNPVGNDLRFFIYDSGVAKIVSQSIDCEKTYMFVVGTYDGSVLKLYANGKLINTLAYTGDIDAPTGGLVFPHSTTVIKYNGYIFNNGVYNIALTATEVKQLYSHLSNPPNITKKIENVLVFNGTTSTFSTGVSNINGDIELLFDGVFNKDGSIIGTRNNTGWEAEKGFSFGIYSGLVQIIFADGVGNWAYVSTTVSYNLRVILRLTMNQTTGALTLYKNGIQVSTYTKTELIGFDFSTETLIFGKCKNFSKFNGTLHSFIIKINNSIVRSYESKNAYETTILNSVGTNHATLENIIITRKAINIVDKSLIFETIDGVIDSSGINTITNIGVVTGSRIMKFGGTGDKLYTTLSMPSVTDFTIDIVFKLDSTAVGGENYYLFRNNSGNTRLICTTSALVGDIAGTSFNYGISGHVGIPVKITITRSGTSTQFYLNGVLWKELISSSSAITLNNFCIGSSGTSSVTQTYLGDMYSFKIYNRTLSYSEIKQDYLYKIKYW